MTKERFEVELAHCAESDLNSDAIAGRRRKLRTNS